jgi:hypothetical protein
MFGCCYLAMGSSDTHLMNMRIEENGNVVSNKSTIIRLKSTKQKKTCRPSCTQKWTFLSKSWSKNDQSFCHAHNVMIQMTLHIPGKMERASVEMDKPWREVSW